MYKCICWIKDSGVEAASMLSISLDIVDYKAKKEVVYKKFYLIINATIKIIYIIFMIYKISIPTYYI